MRALLAVILLLIAGSAHAQLGPSPSPMTGNAYAGRCSLDGSAVILPSANWSCAKTGTGAYQVNVPAGYDARNYAIVVSISGNWKGVIQAYAPAAANFLITIFDQSGVAMDATFGFVVTRNAAIYP